ncbi:hypothetical protein E2C01_060189 [Portunus trituberculatus]|uniref:Uncharacterized protein n=1 Tax=Portunus trituberculatus TaxID=210409 RepID=A0A5B7H815_PORTR|nr:hypothetical protein [Portunus trituberculatus]
MSQSDFTIPALMEYVGDSERDRILCSVRAVKEYLRTTRDCRPRCSRLFMTVTEPRHIVHPHTISHWVCQVIQHAHVDVSEEDMCLVQVKAHEVRAVATSALFRKFGVFLPFFEQEPGRVCPLLLLFISGILLIGIWIPFLWDLLYQFSG